MRPPLSPLLLLADPRILAAVLDGFDGFEELPAMTPGQAFGHAFARTTRDVAPLSALDRAAAGFARARQIACCFPV